MTSKRMLSFPDKVSFAIPMHFASLSINFITCKLNFFQKGSESTGLK